MATAITKLSPIPLQTGSRQAVSLGQLGADYISDTTEYTNTAGWCAIEVLLACTFTKLTTTTIFANGAATPANLAISIAQGLTIYGQFTNIQLSAGAVIAYRA